MSEIQERARAALTDLKALHLDSVIEKRRLEEILVRRFEVVKTKRSRAQAKITRLRPLVKEDLATEADRVEYILTLELRQELNQEYHSLREAVAQLNLPGEPGTLTESVELDGVREEVET